MALAQLRDIRGHLLCAGVIALRLPLSDARAAGAYQLMDKIAATLTVVGQLIESEAR